MAFSYIEVDTVQLNADVNELSSNIAQAQKSLNEFKSEMDELNIMWEGKANQVFRSQIQKDYELMSEILKNVKKLVDSMGNAKKEYERCESSVLNLVNEIRT